jgi:hypothetical protein
LPEIIKQFSSVSINNVIYILGGILVTAEDVYDYGPRSGDDFDYYAYGRLISVDHVNDSVYQRSMVTLKWKAC